MTSVEFIMSNYDIGVAAGNIKNTRFQPIANDNCLNGAEVDIARNDGWDVYEGYTYDGTNPPRIETEKEENENLLGKCMRFVAFLCETFATLEKLNEDNIYSILIK